MKSFITAATFLLALSSFAQSTTTYNNCPTFPDSKETDDLEVIHTWYKADGSVDQGYFTRGQSKMQETPTFKFYTIGSRLGGDYLSFIFSDQGGLTEAGEEIPQCILTADKKSIFLSFPQDDGHVYDLEVYEQLNVVDPKGPTVFIKMLVDGVFFRQDTIRPW